MQDEQKVVCLEPWTPFRPVKTNTSAHELSSVEQKSYEKLHFGDENVNKNGQEKSESGQPAWPCQSA